MRAMGQLELITGDCMWALLTPCDLSFCSTRTRPRPSPRAAGSSQE